MWLRVLAPFCAGYYLSYLLRTVNAVIAPELVREAGLGPADLGFLTSTYFLAFAAAQLPVGLALDRLGPRRTEGALLLVTAVGALVFASGHGLGTLALGRGLAGLGVAACLMGAFKAFGAAFPAEAQASLTGVIMSAGALGALTASAPLAWALPRIGWRGALAGVAIASALVAPAVAFVVPARADGAPRPREPLAVELRALAGVLGTRAFWRFAPQAALFTGGFMALQGLWAVPWLMADGRSRAQAAGLLGALNGGMLAGQLAIAAGATALQRRGIVRPRLMGAGLVLALACEVLLVAHVAAGAAAWFAFGACAAAGAQVYGVAAGAFPPALSARVMTALNLMAFVGAFAIQWGVGAAVQALGSAGTSMPVAFQITLAVLLGAKALAVLWSLRA